MSYIKIVFKDYSKSGKTAIFEVQSVGIYSAILGHISWYAQWRKYCFLPSGGTVFDSKCLEEVKVFLEEETNRHKTKETLSQIED